MYTVLILALTTYLLTQILKILHTAFFSPLSAFPNAHYSAPFSSLWLIYTKARHREHRTRRNLHEKLGPVIRVGPRELSIDDAEEVKTVYGGGFEKSEWYDGFSNYGLPFMFAMRGAKAHGERKRMLSHVYSNTYIQSSPELDEILRTIIQDILSRAKAWAREDAEIDIYQLTKSYGMDGASAYQFGLENRTHFVEESMTGGKPLEIFETSLGHIFLQTDVPRLVSFLRLFGVRLVPDYVSDAWQSVEALCQQKCALAKQNLLGNHTDKAQNKRSYPTVYAQLYRKLQEVETNQEKLDKLIAAEELDSMIAGNEASGITLTYLIWELSNHPEILRKLRYEINASRNSAEPLLIPAKVIDAFPMLDAIVQETLRLHPAAFGPFPRIVPQKGANIGNIDVPGGTLVSVSAYALQHNPSVFPNPDEWRPERWLEASTEKRKEMQRWFWAFGSGSRMCIGNHLAIRMIKTFVVAVFADFEITTAEEKPEQLDGATGSPVAHKVPVKFHALMERGR